MLHNVRRIRRAEQTVIMLFCAFALLSEFIRIPFQRIHEQKLQLSGDRPQNYISLIKLQQKICFLAVRICLRNLLNKAFLQKFIIPESVLFIIKSHDLLHSFSDFLDIIQFFLFRHRRVKKNGYINVILINEFLKNIKGGFGMSRFQLCKGTAADSQRCCKLILGHIMLYADLLYFFIGFHSNLINMYFF